MDSIVSDNSSVPTERCKRSRSANSSGTTEEKEAALIKFEGLLKKAIEGSDADLKELCTGIKYYVELAKPTAGKDQKLILESFMRKLLDFSYTIAVTSKEGHKLLQQEASVLPPLIKSLHDNYENEDKLRILKTVEALVRGLVLTWRLPYSIDLVKIAASLIQTEPHTSDTFKYGLLILVAIEFFNRDRFTVNSKDVSYKTVIKRLLECMDNKTTQVPVSVSLQGFHLYLMTEGAVDLDFQHIESLNLHLKGLGHKMRSETTLENMHNISSELIYTSYCVQTFVIKYCDKHRLELAAQEADEGSQPSQDIGMIFITTSKTLKNVSKLVQSVCKILMDDFCDRGSHVLRSENGQFVFQSMLMLITSLCPEKMPDKIFSDLYMLPIKVLDKLAGLSSKNARSQLAVLGTCNFYLDRVMKQKIRSFQIEELQNAWTNCALVVPTSSLVLQINVASLRWMNLMSSFIQSEDITAVPSVVSEKLSLLSQTDFLSKLLNGLAVETRVPKIELSAFAVEILSVMAKSSKNTTVLMQFSDNPVIWKHIGNCIANGDNQLVAQSLGLLNSFGFSSKCRTGVSSMLVSMRQPYQSPKPDRKPEVEDARAFCPSFRAQLAMRRINENLELFEKHYCEDTSVNIDHILTWYKLKNDMRDMEILNLKEQLRRLDETNSHLNTLMQKQEELVASRTLAQFISTNESMDLKKHLEHAQSRKEEVEAKHAKCLLAIRGQLEHQECIAKLKSEKLAKAEADNKNLRTRYVELEAKKMDTEAANAAALAEMNKIKEKLEATEGDLKSSRQQCATLKKDLQKKDDALKSCEELLEQERRKTEIIQQVLGNRIN